MSIENMSAAEAFLLERINYERTPTIPYQEKQLKLQRMRELLDRIGNPHLGLPCLHVAGTKGKGSTCAMLTSMLVAHGRVVGTYTSPHFQSVLERLSIGGRPCEEGPFVELMRQIQPAIATMDADSDEANHPTYFEILTALAFLYFRQRRVDMAVFEVGLGGRLDSTNVCQPCVSIITSISLDHMLQLGNDLVSIAREKGGIIKPGIPVVSGVHDGGAQQAIQAMARERGSRLYQIGTDFQATHGTERRTFDYYNFSCSPPRYLKDIELSMLGDHQATNGAVALAAMDLLREAGWQLDDGKLREGLKRVAVRGRIEVVGHDPTVILDTAHNSASVQALLEVIDADFSARQRIFVLGTTRGKDVEGMLRQLAVRPDHLILTNYHNNPRSYDAQQLARILDNLPGLEPQGGRQVQCEVIADSAEAWRRAWSLATPKDLICIFGSFFLIAELENMVRAATASAESRVKRPDA